MEKKILMVIAPEMFRDEEYLEPKAIFAENGFEVVTASKEKGLCKGKLGAKVRSDVSIYDVSLSEFLAIVFVGGGGALIYENDKVVHEIIRKSFDDNKLVCAICIAPRILISAGVLNGKRFTMWNEKGSEDFFIQKSLGTYTGNIVESDGNIITADGPSSAKEFARMIVEALK